MSKTSMGTILLGALAALALTASTASAQIVCNEDGDCWHVKKYREYPPDVKLLTRMIGNGPTAQNTVGANPAMIGTATGEAAFG